MRRLCLIPVVLLISCSQKAGPEEAAGRGPEGEVYHDMIQLGEKLDDPYTVANMQDAYTKLYPTKAGREPLSATDYYVRFLPSNDSQLQQLKDRGLYLMDHPMDYTIVREGDYYQDPELSQDAITWQYAVVPRDFDFPAGVRWEKLDECFLSDHLPEGKAPDGVDWTLVEREAFRLTGHEDMLEAATKGSSAVPEGRITIEDPLFSGGKPFGVAGVMVACNVFVKIATTYTDRDGYYRMSRSFSSKPRYRIVFKNERGFNIGFNFIIIPASVCTLGKGGPEGMDCHVKREDGALFRRSAVNNAAWEYYTRCTREDLDVSPPPGDLRIWIFNGLTSSSACMLHHGALLEGSILKDYLGVYLKLIEVFLPDITIGTREMDYSQIYKAVVHELSHASHYARAGNTYWDPYIKYVIQSFVLEGGTAYGSGYKDGAGYCEVGEMWGYFMQESLYKDRYGGTISSFGSTFWFQPDIFTYLYERGMSRGQIYRCLNTEVASIDDLKDELISQYRDQEGIIEQTFSYYGK